MKENSLGVCRLIDDCYSVLHDPEKHKKQPQFCGFDGLKPIVCCPDSASSSELNSVGSTIPINTSTNQPSSDLENRNTNSQLSEKVPSNSEPNREYLVPFTETETDCERFSEAVFEYIQIPESDGTVRHTVREARCSVRRDDNFIGRKACEAKEFPHMVLIGADTDKGARYFCSGALISNQHILTAAHCILNTG